jgi:glyoxylase-like metal-dependent hydrolase (beta-lactamase superfamily II)
MNEIELIEGNIVMMKVNIPIPALKYVNSYVIRGDRGYVIIDTGWDNESSFTSFLSNLNKINVNLNDIKYILITHFHVDHIGLVNRLKNLTKATFILHNEDKKYIEKFTKNSEKVKEEIRDTLRNIGVPKELYQNLNILPWVKRLKFYEEVNEFIIGIKNEEEISLGNISLKAIWTPGHTPGHMCFYDNERKILFTGDHILPTISSNISQLIEEGSALSEFIKSLLKVNDLEVRLGLPAHQGLITDLKARIKELRLHHINRLMEIVESVKNGLRTPYEIAASIKWKLGGKSWYEADPFQKFLALGETLAHLIFLQRVGIIKVEQDRSGIIIYSLNKDVTKEEIINIIEKNNI